jgi:hypothetical protein
LFFLINKCDETRVGFGGERRGLGEWFEFCYEFGFHFGVFFDLNSGFFPVA